MKKYIIAYTLRDLTKDYMDFYSAIKTNVEDCRHIMESAWIVKTDKTANELRELLIPHLTFKDHSCDFLFIGELGEDFDGMLAMSYWKFMKDEEDSEEKK
jgi:hypothetical protein